MAHGVVVNYKKCIIMSDDVVQVTGWVAFVQKN